MHVNELPFINNGEHIEWAPEISTWMSLGVIVESMITPWRLQLRRLLRPAS